MKNTIRKKTLLSLVVTGAVLGCLGCAGKQMVPARIIPPGDDNTRLCKQSYLLCRGECGTVKHKDTRLKCADNCEHDVDSCLLQSREPKKK